MTFIRKKLQKVERIQTSDGSLFTDSDEAIAHQKILDFTEWYFDEDEDNSLGDKSIVPAKSLYEWLKIHRTTLKEILEAID